MQHNLLPGIPNILNLYNFKIHSEFVFPLKQRNNTTAILDVGGKGKRKTLIILK